MLNCPAVKVFIETFKSVYTNVYVKGTLYIVKSYIIISHKGINECNTTRRRSEVVG